MTSHDPRLRIILHADDLGGSERMNDEIFGLMDQEKLTSASILANGPAFDDAVRRSHYFPHCSFGLHLNITDFEPLCPSPALEPLLSPNGCFHAQARRWPLSNALKQAVLAEWTTQLRRVRNAGVPISHIDSHHHTHTLFGLLDCLKQLCCGHDLGRVRIRHTFTHRHGDFGWRIDNRLYNHVLRRHFTCVREFGPFAGFSSALPHFVPGSAVELMLHPGHDRYNGEIQSFAQTVDEDFRHRYQCISYRELN